MFKEFRQFIMQGNILDLALAVIIGGAFGPVVTAMVDAVLMPPIGLLLGGVNFSDLQIMLKDNPEGEADVVIGYGKVIQAFIHFLIISYVVFMLMKASVAMKKKEIEAPAAPPAPTNEEVLLGEIRDLLKK